MSGVVYYERVPKILSEGMTCPPKACLLIKWRDVAALSLRYYCPLREDRKYAYAGILRLFLAVLLNTFTK